MSSKNELLERAKAAIDADPSLPHHLADLAAVAHYGLWHFQRSFTARYGITPGRYVRLLRMRRACYLLETTDYPMGRISGDLGYASMAIFGNCFKREIGMSPTAYRRWARYAAELDELPLSATRS
jgi:transcriptional regulator GlxA family with amidase domain